MGSPTLGAEFEINDHKGVVVGIATVASGGLFGIPTLYTTYGRATQDLPTTRFTMSYVLVEPKSPARYCTDRPSSRCTRLSGAYEGSVHAAHV